MSAKRTLGITISEQGESGAVKNSMLRLTFCAVLLCSANPLWGQSSPTGSAPDVHALLDRLATSSGHDAALDQLKKLPASAIVPLFEAENDESRSKALRSDLAAAIDVIATRERAASAAQDRQSLLAWNSNTSVNIYEKSGADPKWDAAVHKGFSDFDRNAFSTALDSFGTAITAGCTDPLVRYDHDYCALLSSHADRTSLFAALSKSLQDLENSSYPDSRKCAVEASFVVQAMEPEGRRSLSETVVQSALRRGISHYKDLVADHPGRPALRQTAANLYIANGALGGRGKESSKGCIDAISAALPNDALSYFFKAHFYTEWAWEARGGGFASSVTETGAKLFEERLIQARQVAEDGWRLNPMDPDCPQIMISVCMGMGLSRQEMESWFSRAMIADPHNFNACLSKEQYLLPKWEGSVEEALEFGRYCVAHGDAQDRIPTILIRVYRDLVELTPGSNPLLSTPQCWPDLKSAYTKLLADKSRLQTHRDQYLADRGAYFRAACDTQHWKEANALIKEYGKDIDVSAVGGQALYDYFQRKAVTAASQRNAP